ncbi:hypothetical protein ES319_A13G175300v1 [Gossypium barbadense]|uniref:Uncharacterized protein n=2 Tax=Gossypium TaxID=3633 RepID=A0A5J5T0Q4_GOSBA|nr:hypothetical protein ES319_A13G175300v1 [Gossypium barbadense]TYG87116.1 hypothetical protein ES288_A13G187400v1 [Gossypium darwinii]
MSRFVSGLNYSRKMKSQNNIMLLLEIDNKFCRVIVRKFWDWIKTSEITHLGLVGKYIVLSLAKIFVD